jgi:hypothetical protein
MKLRKTKKKEKKKDTERKSQIIKRAGKFFLAACERGSRTPALYNDANWTRISITAS